MVTITGGAAECGKLQVQNRVRSIDQASNRKARQAANGSTNCAKRPETVPPVVTTVNWLPALGLNPREINCNVPPRAAFPPTFKRIILTRVGAGHLQLQGRSGHLGIITFDVDRLRVGIQDPAIEP